jgi:hypothetical protein
VTASAVRWAAAAGFGVLVLGATVAPAIAFDAATAQGGAERAPGIDLVLASAAVGVPYAVLLCRSLARPHDARRTTDQWLAAVHGLVVLALAASALPAAALHVSTRLHAPAADAEWPVLVGWAAVVAVAVLIGEGVRRVSLRWLAAEQRSSAASGSSPH